MKGMKLLAAGILFAAAVQAQTTQKSGVHFGIRAGVNFQNINGRNLSDNKLENKLVPRLQAGVTADVPLADDFYLQPGLLYSGKGTKFKGSNYVLNLSYLDVPVTFLYKPVLGKGRMMLGVGPYVGFALNGKVTQEDGDKSTVKFKNTITLSEGLSDYYYRRMDAGANLLFGYEMSSKLSLQLNAQLGLQKINPVVEGVSNDNTAYRNTGFGLSFGYHF
jgi:hypothetical protein